MGRCLLTIILGICFFSQAIATLMKDVEANLTLIQILKEGKEIASKGAGILSEAQKTANTLFEIDRVMGKRLPTNFISRLDQVGGISNDCGYLLESLSTQDGDALRALNTFGRQHTGSRDFGDILYAKDYFKDRFFPQGIGDGIIPTQSAEKVREHRDQAADDVAIESMAIAKQQKKGLEKDHHNLSELAKSAGQNDTLQYQSNIQTRLLERIALSLEKLILLQTQQLDLMAKIYLKEQPVAFTKSISSDKSRRHRS